MGNIVLEITFIRVPICEGQGPEPRFDIIDKVTLVHIAVRQGLNALAISAPLLSRGRHAPPHTQKFGKSKDLKEKGKKTNKTRKRRQKKEGHLMSFRNSPSYRSPVARISTPYPFFMSSTKSPSYRSPLDRTSTQNPFLMSLTKYPSVESPLEKVYRPLPSRASSLNSPYTPSNGTRHRIEHQTRCICSCLSLHKVVQVHASQPRHQGHETRTHTCLSHHEAHMENVERRRQFAEARIKTCMFECRVSAVTIRFQWSTESGAGLAIVVIGELCAPASLPPRHELHTDTHH